MENSYGIGVANRYALFLDEEEDPLELLKAVEQEKEAKKKTKLSEKENEGVKGSEGKGGKAAAGAVEGKGGKAGAGRKGIKETQNVKPAADKAQRDNLENNKTKATTGDRGERKPRFEPREERNNRFNREERPPGGGDQRPPRQDNDERRGGRGGPTGPRQDRERVERGPRGPRGGAGGVGGGYDNRGKREFDRQSGSDRTGVKAVDKRDGGGAHNWGNPKDDVVEQLNTSEEPLDWSGEKPADVSVTEAPAAGTEAPADAAVDGEGATEAAPEPEPVELTLDEYKALRSARQKPTFNLRKAGEGEDLSQWKPMFAVVKKKDEEDGADAEGEEEEYEVAEYPQRVGRQKHVLDIDIHFADSRRGGSGSRGGAGGRGRGGPRGAPRSGGFRGGDDQRGPATPRGDGEDRGFRGRGSDRGFRGGDRGFRGGDRNETSYASRTPRQAAPKVDDEKAFPSLG